MLASLDFEDRLHFDLRSVTFFQFPVEDHAPPQASIDSYGAHASDEAICAAGGGGQGVAEQLQFYRDYMTPGAFEPRADGARERLRTALSKLDLRLAGHGGAWLSGASVAPDLEDIAWFVYVHRVAHLKRGAIDITAMPALAR